MGNSLSSWRQSTLDSAQLQHKKRATVLQGLDVGRASDSKPCHAHSLESAGECVGANLTILIVVSANGNRISGAGGEGMCPRRRHDFLRYQAASASPFHSGALSSISLPPSASNSVARS